MENYNLSDPFVAIRQEVVRARKLHPGNHHLFLALVEEVGEIAEAIQRGDIEHARQEAVQVACLAVRLIEERDASWFSAKNDEKPPESAIKTCDSSGYVLHKKNYKLPSDTQVPGLPATVQRQPLD